MKKILSIFGCNKGRIKEVSTRPSIKGDKELPIVGENKEGFTYFQVAYTTREKLTLERELAPLQDINDHYPKYILTMDIDPIADYDGIKKVNVLDWLLEK